MNVWIRKVSSNIKLKKIRNTAGLELQKIAIKPELKAYDCRQQRRICTCQNTPSLGTVLPFLLCLLLEQVVGI